MTDLIRVVAIGVGVVLSLISYLVVLGALWPRHIGAAVVRASAEPRRALLLGLVNILFFAAVLVGLFSLAARFENTAIGALLLLAILIIAFILSILVSLGLATITQLVGERLQPHATPLRQAILGATLLVFACLVPFVGWFILLPYVAGLGAGASILSVFNHDSQ